MGYYINNDSKGDHIGASLQQKITNLVLDGAELINTPSEWEEGLVCIVDNGHFAAAGYAYDEKEMNVFLSNCGRTKKWLKYNKAKELAE